MDGESVAARERGDELAWWILYVPGRRCLHDGSKDCTSGQRRSAGLIFTKSEGVRG